MFSVNTIKPRSNSEIEDELSHGVGSRLLHAHVKIWQFNGTLIRGGLSGPFSEKRVWSERFWGRCELAKKKNCSGRSV